MRILTLILTSALIFCFSCKNPESNTTEQKQVIDIKLPDAPLKVPEGWSPNGLDSAAVQMLIAQGDHIDYVFNYMPLSMSQDGTKSFYQEMELVSQSPIPGIPSGCYPMARKVFMGEGEILLEADLYFSDNCFFQVYIKDEKPLYGNLLSEAGVYFYINMLQQAQQTMPDNVKGTIKLPKGIQKSTTDQ